MQQVHNSSSRCSRPIGRPQLSSCCHLLTVRPLLKSVCRHSSSRCGASPPAHQHQQPCISQPQLRHPAASRPLSISSTTAAYMPKSRLVATHVAAAAQEQQPLAEGVSSMPAQQGSSTSSSSETQIDHDDASSSSDAAAAAEEEEVVVVAAAAGGFDVDDDASAGSAADSVPSSSSSSSSSEVLVVEVKVLSDSKELHAVAKLRAEAYYEHDRSRFAASFKKQFASQEAESLRQRTAAPSSSSINSGQRPQLCDCLVAIDASGSVVGCIDIRLPESYTNMKTIGVPEGDAAGCYLLNVVVAEEQRGLGVGKRVMRAAMSRAVSHWGAQRLYTHVEADNEVANRLYRSCGFKEHSSEAKYANTSSLGRLVLLMATADDAAKDS